MNAEQLEAIGVDAIERGGVLKAAGQLALGERWAACGVDYLREAEIRRATERAMTTPQTTDSADWWKQN